MFDDTLQSLLPSCIRLIFLGRFATINPLGHHLLHNRLQLAKVCNTVIHFFSYFYFLCMYRQWVILQLRAGKSSGLLRVEEEIDRILLPGNMSWRLSMARLWICSNLSACNLERYDFFFDSFFLEIYHMNPKSKYFFLHQTSQHITLLRCSQCISFRWQCTHTNLSRLQRKYQRN